MFIYFGDISSGVFNSPRGKSFINQCVLDSPGPVVISLSQREGIFGNLYVSDTVADAMDIISMCKKPVFVKVACSPSYVRTSSAIALSDTLRQIDEITKLLVGYQLLNNVAGFALNNVFFGDLFQDGSQWTKSQLNTIFSNIHSNNKSVMLFSDPSLVPISKYNPARPYVSDNLSGYLADSTVLGNAAGIIDHIVHINALYPWHLYNASYPELVFDFSRFVSIMNMCSQFSNIKQYVHQGHPFAPYPDYFKPGYDGMMGPMLTPLHNETIQRSARFIEACGIVDYCITADTAFGAQHSIPLHPYTYRKYYAEAPTSFIGETKISSSNGTITVYRNDEYRKFTSTLKEII